MWYFRWFPSLILSLIGILFVLYWNLPFFPHLDNQLIDDGRVFGCGANTNGSLGLGDDQADRAIVLNPTEVMFSIGRSRVRITSISCGCYHNLAVDSKHFLSFHLFIILHMLTLCDSPSLSVCLYDFQNQYWIFGCVFSVLFYLVLFDRGWCHLFMGSRFRRTTWA